MDFIQSLGFGDLFRQVVDALILALNWFPYWGPFLLAYVFWHQWMHYIQAKWQANLKWVLLEIKLPKEIHKSPIAMEIALNALYQTSEGAFYDKYWSGKVRDYFSLEMVSIEGDIKFFVRTILVYKNVIEAQLYAQYPDIEIFEVPDYTRYVDYRGSEGEWKVVSAEFMLSKADPYPIKTYVDYGLDKEGIKEEFKIDPLTSVIEFLGSIGKGEQIWMQILVRAARKRYHKHDGSMGDWKDEGTAIIDKLTRRNEKTPEGMPVFKMLMATKGENEVIAAIERSMGKLGFDCGIRVAYVVKKDKFNPSNQKAIGGILRPFTTANLNGFEIHSQTFGYDNPWQSYFSFDRFFVIPEISFDENHFISGDRKKQFDAYKHRSWFYLPHKVKPFVLTTEELATIFHFPGGVAQTPTFGRIPSRKGEAPIDLPV